MATRTTLRRNLGKRLGQPFFRKFGGVAGAASANGTTTTLVDTSRLREGENYWRGSYIYLPTTDEIREISAFSNGTIVWHAPIASATTASQAYEVWSQFTPQEVHEALNRALQSGWPQLFMTTVDESVPIQTDKGFVYTLPTTNTIRRLCEVWMMVYPSVTGTVTSTGTNVQVKDTGASFDSDDVGSYVAIYEDGGSATGDIRQVSTVDSGTQITVSTAFTAILPTSTKYRLFDKTHTDGWQMMLNNWMVDAEDFPTTIWFSEHFFGYEGFPLKLIYEHEYTSLAAEASTTNCPEEYLYNQAMVYLHTLRLGSAPAAEVPNIKEQIQIHALLAEQAKLAFARQHKPGTIRKHDLAAAAEIASNPFLGGEVE